MQPAGASTSQQTPAGQQGPAGPTTTVQGVVKNAATGAPLERALVQLEGESGIAALTDGDGRFELRGVGLGPQVFALRKPGFEDAPSSGIPGVEVDPRNNTSHNVVVEPGMAELTFTLRPTNSISGRMELSTGDPAQGMAVMLLRRTVQDGRATWAMSNQTATRSDGTYRFAGLEDGSYMILTQPAMESGTADLPVDKAAMARAERSGYPPTYYPDARDAASAGHIDVAGGQQAQANLTLTLAPFHLVTAIAAAGANLIAPNANVLDEHGRQLPYPVSYDAATHTVQAMLPDGTYTMRLSGMQGKLDLRSTIQASENQADYFSGPGRVQLSPRGVTSVAGQTDVTVAGHPVTNLRIALAPESVNSVQISLVRSGGAASSVTGKESVFISLTQGGAGVSDGMSAEFAQGQVPGVLPATPMSPGQYWVHTVLSQGGLCEASFTAGGANLAREPLVIANGGGAPPLALTLRDDCASLQLSLPEQAAGLATGEETAYTVFVVPDFDSTTDIQPVTLRSTSGGTFTLHNLAPGAYHVFAFTAPVNLEYRNRELLTRLGGQGITLEPGGSATLPVEAVRP